MTLNTMPSRALSVVKGPQPLSPSVLDYTAPYSATIPAQDKPVMPGAIMQVNASGEFILGLGSDKVVPLINWSKSDGPDVTNDGGNPATDRFAWTSTSSEVGNALVCTGGYEIATTQFVTGQTYNPNTPLTANKSGSADPGKLRPGTLGTHMIAGFVSRGVIDNGYGYDALTWWTCPVFPS